MIRTEHDVTPAVLAELENAQNPRFKAIMQVAIKHLHAFAREARLTEPEFYEACNTIAKLGQACTASHNEVVLMAGAMGLSTLVCLLNNPPNDTVPSTANLLGPFWRTDSPPTANGGSIVRSATVGVPLFISATVRDQAGQVVAGARVDVWNTSADGYYENQDPEQIDMNLRGQFTTNEAGKVWFKTIKPCGYPVPVNGVVGDWLRAQGRHNMRPAHVHFLIAKDGYKTQFAQLYDGQDSHLETDSQFGVTAALVGDFKHHKHAQAQLAPDRARLNEWYSAKHTFYIRQGASRLPTAPITGKSQGKRPAQAVLQRQMR